jgi:hypothetical protein
VFYHCFLGFFFGFSSAFAVPFLFEFATAAGVVDGVAAFSVFGLLPLVVVDCWEFGSTAGEVSCCCCGCWEFVGGEETSWGADGCVSFWVFDWTITVAFRVGEDGGEDESFGERGVIFDWVILDWVPGGDSKFF